MRDKIRSDAVLIPFLREHGPTPIDKIPTDNINVSNRRRGVSSFNCNRIKKLETTSIIYIFGKHRKKDVILQWLEANFEPHEFKVGKRGDGMSQSVGYRIGQHGKSWKRAWRQALKEFVDEDQW